MKIVTLGCSPYLLTSIGKIHSWIIQDLYFQGHEIAILAHSHDTTYFVPEKVEDKTVFCYSFDDHKVPIFPYRKGGTPPEKTEAVAIYELLEVLKPDLVISIDDYSNMIFMQAVKMFLPDEFKWLWVLVNGDLPIQEDSRSVATYADSILCTNQFTFDHLKGFCDKELEWHYAGCDLDVFSAQSKKKKDLQIFSSAKNTFKDCPASAIEICKKSLEICPNLKLNLHTNSGDNGFYDLSVLQGRFDSNDEFLRMPDEYVSIKDGYSAEKMNSLLSENHIFLSTSVASGASIGLFEALAAGCLPLINNQGCDREIIKKLEKEIKMEGFFLVNGVNFMTSGEKNITIPNGDEFIPKMRNLADLIKTKEYEGIQEKILNFSKGYHYLDFVKKVNELINSVMNKKEKIFSLT